MWVFSTDIEAGVWVLGTDRHVRGYRVLIEAGVLTLRTDTGRYVGTGY